MQTFLPYPNIIESVQCLDNKRLGKQRVEAYQILRALTGYSSKWINHPAVRMWKGYNACLEMYMNLCIFEWVKRGFNNTMLICWPIDSKDYYKDKLLNSLLKVKIKYPFWFGIKGFHDSHKSNLLRKYPEHYKQFNWDVPNNSPYIWPVK